MKLCNTVFTIWFLFIANVSGDGCLYGTHSIVKRSLLETNLTESEDVDVERCNSDKLERIMRENMNGDYQDISLNIMKYAEQSIGGPFSVICARADFAYVTRTRLYCLHSIDDLNCFAYLSEQ